MTSLPTAAGKRPKYKKLLDLMAAGTIQGIIAWHTDRLHRSPKELETFIDLAEKSGIVTHTVRAGEIDLSTPSGARGRPHIRCMG
jgi:site-specific DNA recombinase